MADAANGGTPCTAEQLLRLLAVEAPELLRAAADVELSLLDRAARLTPLERVEVSSRHLAELRSFRAK